MYLAIVTCQWRAFALRRKFLQQRAAATVIARRGRVFAARCLLRRRRQRATTIASVWRMHSCRAVYRRQVKSMLMWFIRELCFLFRFGDPRRSSGVYITRLAGAPPPLNAERTSLLPFPLVVFLLLDRSCGVGESTVAWSTAAAPFPKRPR